MSDSDMVSAAGCVAWRTTDDGVEVVLVHRPSPRSDWSLPKGKLEPGERARDAAVRELFEETGIGGRLGSKLVEVGYMLPDGRPKEVRWWVLRAESDAGFEPNEEIDDRRWASLDAAAELVTWDTDRRVLDEFRRSLERPDI